MPDFFLFGGPNGAGKTTIALRLLRDLGVREFVNADAIAAGLSPLNRESVALQAGALMMRRLRELRERGESFGMESTLAARAFVPFIRECQARGYEFHLVFVWLPSPDMAVQRVRARVASGGHDIPEETIRRRYEAGRENFVKLYLPLADQWRVYDNEREQSEVAAHGQQGQKPVILNARVWEQLNA